MERGKTYLVKFSGSDFSPYVHSTHPKDLCEVECVYLSKSAVKLRDCIQNTHFWKLIVDVEIIESL